VERRARRDVITTRKVAILLEEGFDEGHVKEVRAALEAEGARPMIVAERHGLLQGSEGGAVKVDKTFLTTDPVLWDAVFVPVGAPRWSS